MWTWSLVSLVYYRIEFPAPPKKTNDKLLGRSTPDDIMDMFKNFYSDDALPMGFDKTRLPQDKWTPAELVQVLPKKNNTDVS